MTITFDGGTGLFDRIGKIVHALNVLNTHIGGSASGDLPTEINDALVKFDASSNDIRSTTTEILAALTGLQDSGANDIRLALQQWAEKTLIETVDADNPLPSKTVELALDELIRQMEENSESIVGNEPTIASLVDGPENGVITNTTQANPVVVTSNGHGLSNGDIVTITGVGGHTQINDRQFIAGSVATNTFELQDENGLAHSAYTSGGVWRSSVGNGVMVTSVLDGNGKTRENVLQEDIIVKCTANTTGGSESFSISGERDKSTDKLHHAWPSGSGGAATLTVGSPSATTVNVLANGDFEAAWAANIPASWSLDTGTGGTDIAEESSTVFRGSKALKFIGGTATNIELSQAITGLKAHVPYAVQVRLKVDVAPAAGVLNLSFYDSAAIIADDEGVDNDFGINLVVATTNWTPYSTVFRLPDPVPSTVEFRFKVETHISVGTNVFVDDVAVVPMTEAYVGGPYIALFQGSQNFAVNDAFSVAVTNDQRGDFQKAFHRLYGLPKKQLPSNTASGESINDNLIG